MKLSLALIIMCSFAPSIAAWGNNGGKRIKLVDVNTLTLYHGKMTKGQRSSPIPQLECINKGTAPCSAFYPKAVQCINRGSDGFDIQWECKSDMDNSLRFGEIDVSCEGYDYPDDPYILYGSCGLKYSLDYTQEGNHYQKTYSSDSHQYYNTHSSKKSKSTTSNIIADLIVYIGMGLIMYALYKTCTGTRRHRGETAYSSMDDDYPSGSGGGGYGWFGGGQPSSSYSGYDNASCRNRNSHYNGTGGGGFWTGAATGGLLGYMLGNRGGGWGGGTSTWRGGSPSGTNFQSHSSDSSSGTHTASGFGGTSRR